ncbi:MAG: hypothetical protein ACLGHN_12195 [Bacteriovoracia bacterium]
MKHFNRYHLSILPLLSILAMSPSMVESKFAGRQIASVSQEVVKGHPKYEALVAKVDEKSLAQDLELDLEKFKVKRNDLQVSLKKERDEFKKDQSDKEIVAEQEKKVESLVIDILLVEGGLKTLKEKQAIDQVEEEASMKALLESKDVVESLLNDLDANKVLVAEANKPKTDEPKTEEPKKEDGPVVVDTEEPKKEEPKKEDKPVVVADSEEPKKEEPKEEEPKKEDEPKKEVCEADEKNKVLTAQVEELLKQQNQILQTMMGMAQMMVQMNQRNMMSNSYGSNFQIQNPYMYHQPFAAGNWIYMPNGSQPNQINIFNQGPQTNYGHQMPQMNPGSSQGFYPDQAHLQQQPQQSPWTLQPTNYFGDSRFNTVPMNTGNFGSEPFAFNMTPQVPTVSQF